MHKRPSDMARRERDTSARRAAALSHLGTRAGRVRTARAGRVLSEAPARPAVPFLTFQALADFSGDWVAAAEEARRSPRTIEEYRRLREKLLWFLETHGLLTCGTAELRSFLAYVGRIPTPDRPRWGNPGNAHNLRPVSETTLAAYHRDLRALFNFLRLPAGLAESPMAAIAAPRAAPPVIETFTPQQWRELLAAAKRSYWPARNTALLWFLMDTGARRGEVVNLLTRSVDFAGRRALVLGKGRKERVLPFGPATARALLAYHNDGQRSAAERFFVADQGDLAGVALTENGLYQIIERLGAAARIQGVRCSPHTFRHSMAVEFLRGGGGELALQEILGHTTLEMTRRYARLAAADIQERHRLASPAERLRRR